MYVSHISRRTICVSFLFFVQFMKNINKTTLYLICNRINGCVGV